MEKGRWIEEVLIVPGRAVAKSKLSEIVRIFSEDLKSNRIMLN